MSEQDKVTVTDCITMVNIIDICSQRGAFKGDELATIGMLRNKLVEFVKANSTDTESE